MRKLILISMVMLSAFTAHAESKKEVRTLKNFTLENYYDYELVRIIPNTGMEQSCRLFSNANKTTTVEAGTIFTVDAIKFSASSVVEIPFVNKTTRTSVELSSEDQNIKFKIECNSKRYLRRAVAELNKVDLETALLMFADLIN